MIYLASPYSHPDPLIMKTRFLLAEECVIAFTQQLIHVYSPIVHYHLMAQKAELPTYFTFWQAINFDMIRRADAFYILSIPGWEESKGVTAENEFAKQCGLPIYMVNTAGEIILDGPNN